MNIKALLVAGLTTLTLTTTPNVWAGNVSWSITIGNGGGYNGGHHRSHYRPHYVRPRPVVVVNPRPIYYHPRPVVVVQRPRPVYVRPRPVVVVQRPQHYRPRPVVVIHQNYSHGRYNRPARSHHYRPYSANSHMY